MSKSTMNLKYKSKKRVRNNNKNVEKGNTPKETIITIAVVVGFIAILYLGALGLEKLGVFEAGYTKPESSAEISYEDILIGEVFNRPGSEYLVLFDTFGDKTNDIFVKSLADNYSALNIYYVDMSSNENKNYISESSNYSANSVDELKINGITLMRITNGRSSSYITGSEAIIEYLKK